MGGLKSSCGRANAGAIGSGQPSLRYLLEARMSSIKQRHSEASLTITRANMAGGGITHRMAIEGMSKEAAIKDAASLPVKP